MDMGVGIRPSASRHEDRGLNTTGVAMKFSYTHHMPYTAVETYGQDWPVANKQFDPEQGVEIFRTGIENKVYAEECGFDWIGSNEHHMSPYGLMPNPNDLRFRCRSRYRG